MPKSTLVVEVLSLPDDTALARFEKECSSGFRLRIFPISNIPGTIYLIKEEKGTGNLNLK